MQTQRSSVYFPSSRCSLQTIHSLAILWFSKCCIFQFHLLVFSCLYKTVLSNSVVHKLYLGMGKLDFVDVLNNSLLISTSSSVILIISQLRYSRGIKARGEEFRWLEKQPLWTEPGFKSKKYLHYFPCFPLPVKLHTRKYCPITCIKATFILSQLKRNDGFSMWYCLLLLSIWVLETKLQKVLCKQHNTIEGQMPMVKDDLA